VNPVLHVVHYDGDEHELQLVGQAPQAVPSVVGAYPD